MSTPQDQSGTANPANATFGPSVVRLFGIPIEKASKRLAELAGPSHATPNELPWLVEVYGFSSAGRYFPLQSPALFVLYGDGIDAPSQDVTDAASFLGFAQTVEQLTNGLNLWVRSRYDITHRLDLSPGMLQDLLFPASADATGRTDIVTAQQSSFFGRMTR